MSEREFGLRAVGDHKFLRRLRAEAGVTLRTIEKAESFIAVWRAQQSVVGTPAENEAA